MAIPSLIDVRIYPIKSLSGILLNNAKVEPQGLVDDRRMMLVDENGLFISQRKYPQLALIKTRSIEQQLQLSAPMFNDLLINPTDFENQSMRVKIWSDECCVNPANSTINQWFSQYLGKSVSLVKYDNHHLRRIDPLFSKVNDSVSFADGFPLLVISQASLDDLNTRLATPVTMTHFRPNIVVSNVDAYAEEKWKNIKIGEVEFDAVKTCSRCIMTSVDPNTGIKNNSGEPLKTLSNYHKIDGRVVFGMNLIPRNIGRIEIGQNVEINK